MRLYKNGNYYVGIGEENNKRVMYQLTEEEESELIPKNPELIDIKLTNVCEIGCKWCYQNSTKDSIHGDTEQIKEILSRIEGTITEVAFGGGDVLCHPDIVEILKYSRACGIESTNVTLNYLSILNDVNGLKEIAPYISALGISITGRKTVSKVMAEIKDLNIPKERICFHIIPDIFSKKVVLSMLEEIKEYCSESDILFLGYKNLGRGKEYESKLHINVSNMKEYFEYIVANQLNLQADTKLIQDYKEDVVEISNPLFYKIKEGEFSLNIDCVDNFYSIASYNLAFKGDIGDILSKGIPYAFGTMREHNNLRKFDNEK